MLGCVGWKHAPAVHEDAAIGTRRKTQEGGLVQWRSLLSVLAAAGGLHFDSNCLRRLGRAASPRGGRSSCGEPDWERCSRRLDPLPYSPVDTKRRRCQLSVQTWRFTQGGGVWSVTARGESDTRIESKLRDSEPLNISDLGDGIPLSPSLLAQFGVQIPPTNHRISTERARGHSSAACSKREGS